MLLAVVFAVIAIRRGKPRSRPVGFVAASILGGLTLGGGDRSRCPRAPWYPPTLAILLAVLGILGGIPITVWVSRSRRGRSTRRAKGNPKPSAHDGAVAAKTATDGEHGGIVVPVEETRKHQEVLRGGWVIGYLERIAIIAAVALGRFEIVAAVIAVKGLGRFTELDNAGARAFHHRHAHQPHLGGRLRPAHPPGSGLTLAARHGGAGDAQPRRFGTLRL